MLLAIDIGNTVLHFGLFNDETRGTRKQRTTALVSTWSLPARPYPRLTQIRRQLDLSLKQNQITPLQINGAILCSVVPMLTEGVQAAVKRSLGCEVMQVTHRLKTGLTIRYNPPNQLGADRIAHAAAAYFLYGGPVIVVDMGTATTFCVVSKGGLFLGGAIAPGLMTSVEALWAKTAQLPLPPIKRPAHAIGSDTLSALQSGAFFGHASLVDGIVLRMCQEIGKRTKKGIKVIACGGAAEQIASECKTIYKVHPTLTLEGLMIIYRMNK